MIENVREDECAQDGKDFQKQALPHLEKLYRIAAWLTPDQASAETLVQEVLTQALKSTRQLEGETDACVWLLRIMYKIKNAPRPSSSSDDRHAAGDASGDGVSSVVVLFEPPTPQDVTEDELRDALRCLPPESREVILLTDVEELDYKEVADVLGVAVGVVMTRLAHGRKTLRSNLRHQADAQRNRVEMRTAHTLGVE